MTLKEIYAAIEKIGCLSITTLDGETMHPRIVHMMGQDDDGIYFLTMNSKPFYRQLKANGHLALCGIWPSSYATGKNEVGQPAWEPGYTFRLSGHAREMEMDTIKKRADAGNGMFQYFLEDAARYPATKLFCIYKGKGEIFDYDFEMVNRDHKVLRTRFSFGGETHNAPGARITGDCIACGICEDTCTFKAVVAGEPFTIDGSRCDECGSCVEACPQDAIELPWTL
ncbi:4Fe-4S binding protein [Pseudodesulfovibrio sp. zrk46]|uniref:4Fe-4S binding protein n=1 Tax=Pseudodesulfovibrio sp. zrk46 TaxID=2725288 RepID=UPI0014497CFE|nr:4Fe-4S binding protein [Pseudodesulfovibrio sp. zrk46]QJB57241.1 4Fe-4S binding protein [Pseudodesulfovibrio sp. zrk46]